MIAIDFHFDPVSPYAYLAFEQLPQLLEGLSISVTYRPLLFAGLLRHWGQKGPAEIEPKRAWTFRQVHWLASRLDIPLATPAQHPFNPLALLRLLTACAPEDGTPSRWACERVLHHVWRGDGADANEAARLQALAEGLAPERDPQSDAVKQALRSATDRAVAAGIFGVPSMVVGDRVFWGLDGLEMMNAWLRGDPFLNGPGWVDAGAPRPGLQRGS